MAPPSVPKLLRGEQTLRMPRPKAPKLLRGEQTLRMARPKAPRLLLCKETLTMALPKAPKLLPCAITLQMALAKAHKVLVCLSTGSMVLIMAPKQSELRQRPAREGMCVPAHTAPPMKALWLWLTRQAPARRALGPPSSVVNVAANKCANSKLPRPSSHSWRTCPSQSGTMGRAQQSKDFECANCLQLRCTVRACGPSDLHGMHVQSHSVNEAHFACCKCPKRLLLWR